MGQLCPERTKLDGLLVSGQKLWYPISENVFSDCFQNRKARKLSKFLCWSISLWLPPLFTILSAQCFASFPNQSYTFVVRYLSIGIQVFDLLIHRECFSETKFFNTEPSFETSAIFRTNEPSLSLFWLILDKSWHKFEHLVNHILAESRNFMENSCQSFWQ